MPKNTTQEERLDYLVEEFKADSDEYKELQTPNSREINRNAVIYKRFSPIFENTVKSTFFEGDINIMKLGIEIDFLFHIS